MTGIKPTYGTVSRYGLIAYGSSLDQIGPVAKDVTDCATILEAITSYDKKDSTSVKREDTDFTSALVDDVKGMKIGIPRDYLGEGLDAEVKDAVLAAAKKLEEKGAIVEEFDLSLVEYAIPAYYVIAAAEASSNLARFDGVKYGYRTKEYDGLHNMYKKSRSEGFGAEVKRRIMLGSFVLSSGYYDAYYLKALRTKALIKQAFDKAFAKYDVILGPAAPTTAPKLGESLSDPLRCIWAMSTPYRSIWQVFRASACLADWTKTDFRSACSSSETALKKRTSSVRHTVLNRPEAISTARWQKRRKERRDVKRIRNRHWT